MASSFSYLTHGDLLLIKQNLAAYRWAADKAGFGEPLVCAPAHYRESELADHGDPGPEPEGPFGCDQGGDDELRAYYWDVCDRYEVPRPVNLDFDLETAALVFLHELKSKLRGVSPKEAHLNEDCLADAYFGYNGRSPHATEFDQTGKGSTIISWHWSPYVASDPAAGLHLKFIGYEPDGNGDRKRIERPETRPGAIVVWREIMARRAELA